ncbi:uncharacterized protein PG998_005072 [Apiospora kogelbergensis]|uniref:uncharacterized protein n=1 Tax=Apiospora kogelbergensis TaxID=1337665 RepID=UPI0031306CA7
MRRSGSLSERQPFVDPAELPSPASSTTLGEYDYDAEDVEKNAARRGLLSAGGGQSWSSWLRSRQRGFRRIFRRHPGRPLFTVLKYAILMICILFCWDPDLCPVPQHYRDLAARCAVDGGKSAAASGGCANPFKEKVFISVSLYDKDGHLAMGSWGQTLLELVHLIGEDNVYVSIYENDSGEAGEKALNWLKSQLKCRHKVVYDPHVALSDFPTVRMPDGTDRTKRLAYLSEMRNRPLRPLDQVDEQDGVVEYDKILFLNDVAFHPVDAAQLLFSTNIGPDGRTRYLSTCGMDFDNPLLFYDLYAQRDAEGFSNGLPIFPYFSNAGAGLSRTAVLRQVDAVPVTACWGGIVAMQARYVQNLNSSMPDPQFRDIGRHVIDPAKPVNVASPVRFRYEPEVFYDACECCLFLADVTQAARKQIAGVENQNKDPGDLGLGTYVNPFVRVAYSQKTLAWLPWVRRWERLLSVPQRILTSILRLPTHNPHRAVREGEALKEEIWINNDGGGGGGRWELVPRQARNGMQCGVREMQLVQQSQRTNDVNWQNTQMPPGQALYFPT